MSSALSPLTPQQELDYIKQKSAQLGLDPEAVLAVAAHEGVSLPSQVGDSGTSFGPWQLHSGGRLPPEIFSQGSMYAQRWANSKAGIDYALNGIATVAKGQSGPAAVTSIVNLFEQPRADLRAGEIARSITTYNQGGRPSSDAHGAFQIATGSEQAGRSTAQKLGGGDLSPVGDVLSAPGDLIRFVTSWRFAEIVGGIILLVVGLLVIARSLGMSVPTPGSAVTKATQSTEKTQAIFSDEVGPTETAHAAAQPTSRPKKPKMVSHTLEADRPAPMRAVAVDYGEVPF